MTTKLQNFHVRMMELRREKGLSQHALALACGSTLSTINKLECSNRQPSLTLALRIAAALGVEIEDLLTNSRSVR